MAAALALALVPCVALAGMRSRMTPKLPSVSYPGIQAERPSPPKNAKELKKACRQGDVDPDECSQLENQSQSQSEMLNEAAQSMTSNDSAGGQFEAAAQHSEGIQSYSVGFQGYSSVYADSTYYMPDSERGAAASRQMLSMQAMGLSFDWDTYTVWNEYDYKYKTYGPVAGDYMGMGVNTGGVPSTMGYETGDTIYEIGGVYQDPYY